MWDSFLEGTASPSYPVELDASNAISKPSRRPLHETQRHSNIKHFLEQTGSPDSVVCLRIIEEHKDSSFLICRLKAIANELGQSEALVGGTSALAEPGLPRAEERLRLQPPGRAIDYESLKQFPDGGRKSNRAITAHRLWVFLFFYKRDNRRCSPGLWAPSRSPARVQEKQKLLLRVQWKVFE